MIKIVMIFFAAVACIQLIKPLGWPGLKQRRDAWKLVMAGFMAIVVAIGLRMATDPASGQEAHAAPEGDVEVSIDTVAE